MAFKKLKVKVGQVTGTHTNFPTLIQPSLITGLGSITLAEAQSARFYSDVGKTTEIAREIVSADEIHVKVTSMEALAEIWMDYDGIRADYATTNTYGAEAVWADYAGVWHLNSVVDSAGNNADLSTFGGITVGGYSASLPFGGNATDFDGSNDYLTAPDSAFTNVGTGDFTTQAWIRPNVIQFQPYFVKGGRTGGEDSYAQDFYNISGNGRFGFLLQDTSSGFTNFIPTTNYSVNQWYYHTTTFDRSASGTVYIDGSSIGSQSLSSETGDVGGTDPLSFGIRRPSSPISFLDGQLKELRLLKSVLSANWITTEYNNQNANGSFWEATDAGGGAAAQAARRGVIMMM